MTKILRPLDALFNRIFTSDYNPLYRTGTIAVGLLLFIMITGLYLCFFYRLGEPYESILSLQNNIWLGRWVRTAHRYASDVMVVAVVFHIIRMITQGKSWGPRVLAWLTGVVLLLFLMISGWTGYVMVWDSHGQTLASTGAKMMDSLGIFSDAIGRSFDGSSTVPASFFFLNLFLHIIIPLAMIFGLWLHTSKMANAVWLPHKRLFQSMSFLLVLVSMIWPAPLGPRANLLQTPTNFSTDWYYNFWLPLAQNYPRLALACLAVGFVLLASLPWFLRPAKAKQPEKSFNEQAKCQGCTQCVQDCPYEAISMVDRTLGSGSTQVAQVNPELCVSCGLCGASCAPFTMGPHGRKGTDQLARARELLSSLREKSLNPKEKTLVMTCQTQDGVFKKIKTFCDQDAKFEMYPIACAGSIVFTVVDHLARNFSHVAMISCPERNCQNKDGSKLLVDRYFGRREPTFANPKHRENVHLLSGGDGEENRIMGALASIGFPKTESAPSFPGFKRPIIANLFAMAILFAIVGGTHIKSGAPSQFGFLRLSFRLSGQSVKTCRIRTDQELAALPAHMRTPEFCTFDMLSYRVTLEVDGKEVLNELERPGGLHKDRPIYVNHDIVLPPGSHLIRLNFAPEKQSTEAIALQLEEAIQVRAGEGSLVYLSADQKSLLTKSAHE